MGSVAFHVTKAKERLILKRFLSYSIHDCKDFFLVKWFVYFNFVLFKFLKMVTSGPCGRPRVSFCIH